MQVFIQTLSGRTIALSVRPSDSLQRVRELVEEAEGIPARMQRLRLPRRGAAAPGCSLLGDGPCCSLSTLAACGVRPHDTLRLSLRLRGGIDRNNRAGSKPGAGPISSTSANADRRDRLRRLAMETVDLSKDPYFMKNHLGIFECKLCLTLHNTEGNYLAHTQGKRHQTNLAKRAARDAQMRGSSTVIPRAAASQKVSLRRKVIRIGRPGYKVVKQRDSETAQRSLLFEISYPEIEEGMQPRHRFMSAYEQVRLLPLITTPCGALETQHAAQLSLCIPLPACRTHHSSPCPPHHLLAAYEQVRVHQASNFCTPSALQIAIAIALRQAERDDYWSTLSTFLQAKRDRLCKLLRLANLAPIVPQGGYFVLTDTSKILVSTDYTTWEPPKDLALEDHRDFKVCQVLTERAGVSAICFAFLISLLSSCILLLLCSYFYDIFVRFRLQR